MIYRGLQKFKKLMDQYLFAPLDSAVMPLKQGGPSFSNKIDATLTAVLGNDIRGVKSIILSVADMAKIYTSSADAKHCILTDTFFWIGITIPLPNLQWID